MNKIFETQKGSIAAFCRKHDINPLSLFGSRLTGDAGIDSDIDLIVEFDPCKEPGLMAMAAMERELSAILGEQRVDLRTPADLSRYFREAVIRSSQVQYAR
jgi:uncharacterized protein